MPQWDGNSFTLCKIIASKKNLPVNYNLQLSEMVVCQKRADVQISAFNFKHFQKFAIKF